jgi:GxxExxY protein
MTLLYEKESYKIRGAAFKVYKDLGFGHKETVYQRAFEQALLGTGLKIEKEKRLPVMFENKKVGTYTPDFLVEKEILIELKAKNIISDQDIRQFWQYLTGTNYKLGFLINFGQSDGVKIIRRVYDLARKFPRNSASSSALFSDNYETQ